jgi:hypothetical protein
MLRSPKARDRPRTLATCPAGAATRVGRLVAEPRVGVDLLGDDEREPGDAEALPEPDQRLGERAGQDHVPDERDPAEPQRPARLDEPAVHATDAGERVEVERERDPEGDQGHLGRLADPEPEDEQRDQPVERERPQHLHGRVDGVLAEPAEPGGEREHDRRDGADREAAGDALE